jgi:aminodeoxyfutalosine synthase
VIKTGKLAQVARRRLHGNKVYFNKNRHINPTNVCAFHCNFCSFARTSDSEEGAFTYMPEEIPDRVRAAVEAGVREFHIVGGCTLNWASTITWTCCGCSSASSRTST